LNRLLGNVSLLFVVQLFSYLIPIIEIPILARSLGAESYGSVVMVQSIAILASLFMEFGFGISGARQVALSPDDGDLISKVFSDILSAKLVIALPLLLVVGVLVGINYSSINAELIFFGVLYFLAFGLSPMWLFQGKECLAGFLIADLLVRLMGLAVLLLLLGKGSGASAALGVMAGCAFFNTLLANLMCLRWIRDVTFSFQGAKSQIRSSFHVFIYKSSNNVLLNSGPALVSSIGGAQVLASYVPAEKIVRGLSGLAGPILVGVFPLTIRLFKGLCPSLFLPMLITVFLGVSGGVVAVLVGHFGEYLMSITLGPGFESSAEVIKVFIWVVPLRMVNQAIGLTVLIPMNKDKFLSILTLCSSLFAVLGVFLFCFLYGAKGAAFGFILAEIILFMGMVIYISKMLLCGRTVFDVVLGVRSNV